MNFNPKKRSFSFFHRALILVFAALLGACAHPIVISPLETSNHSDTSVSPKKAAYVMTDADRNKEVITEGGGGDKVSYFPYRDLEKSIRDALHAEYSDVLVIKSAADMDAIRENGISFIFIPEITTSSHSSSIFTWPPTQFTIDLSCSVNDPAGNTITRIKAVGKGSAEFSEFKADFGLAGRRAASDLSEKLRQEIKADQRLR